MKQMASKLGECHVEFGDCQLKQNRTINLHKSSRMKLIRVK